MYYGNEISRMLEWEKAKETLAAIEEGGDDAIFTAVSAHYKLSTRNDKFQVNWEFRKMKNAKFKQICDFSTSKIRYYLSSHY